MPEDEALLHGLFARLSESSVYLRFFGPLRRLTDQMAHRFANVDGRTRYALAACVSVGDLEAIIGVARFDIIPRTRTAEVAIVIADDHQGQGLGSFMLSCLADAARARGVERWRFMTLADNAAVMRMGRRLGEVRTIARHGAELEFEVDLEDPPASRR
jgi:RimJ/RimL family protein N-acetyltransferase